MKPEVLSTTNCLYQRVSSMVIKRYSHRGRETLRWRKLTWLALACVLMSVATHCTTLTGPADLKARPSLSRYLPLSRVTHHLVSKHIAPVPVQSFVDCVLRLSVSGEIVRCIRGIETNYYQYITVYEGLIRIMTSTFSFYCHC